MKKLFSALMFMTVCLTLLICFGVSAGAFSGIKAPGGVKVKNEVGAVRVSWQKVNSATRYAVYRRDNDTLRRIATVEDTAYKDESVSSNTRYQYCVRAYMGIFAGEYSDEKSIVYMAAPSGLALKNQKSSIEFSWDSVQGAEKYLVYKRQKGKSWSVVKTLSASQKRIYKDTSVKNGVTYYYTVRCKKGEYISSFISNKKITRTVSPKLDSVYNVPSGVKIRWSAVKGADKYTVYRKSGNGTFAAVKTLGSSVRSYTDTGVKHAGTYTYSVVAVDNGSKSVKSNYKSIMYLEPGKITSMTNTKNGIELTWTKGKGVTGCVLYRKNAKGGWNRLGKLTAQSYTDKNVKQGVTYTYTLIQYNSKYKSSFIKSGFSKTYQKPASSPVKGKKLVALTFDDGPYSPVTNRILDCLEKYNSKATFFVVGSRIESYSSCVVRAHRLGNEIGNHTFDHTTLTTATDSTVKQTISKTNSLIKKYTGKNAAIVRAPGGAVNDRVKKLVNYPLVNWSVDTLDWKYRDKKRIVSTIKNNVRDGSIVLMHDLYPTTADAACEIIPWLCKNGYQLVTVSELMRAKGVDFKPGRLYTRGY